MRWLETEMNAARKQREAVEEIVKAGGGVAYACQFDLYGRVIPGPTPPGPAWLRALAGDDLFADVTVVNLNLANVSDAGLERLKALTQLHGLWLDGDRISDAGLTHLKGLTQLQSLNLGNTKVSDAGLEHLKGLTQLRELVLGGTNVTDKGVQTLQQALPNCKIEH